MTSAVCLLLSLLPWVCLSQLNPKLNTSLEILLSIIPKVSPIVIASHTDAKFLLHFFPSCILRLICYDLYSFIPKFVDVLCILYRIDVPLVSWASFVNGLIFNSYQVKLFNIFWTERRVWELRNSSVNHGFATRLGAIYVLVFLSS